jgi:hypothetical protein
VGGLGDASKGKSRSSDNVSKGEHDVVIKRRDRELQLVVEVSDIRYQASR